MNRFNTFIKSTPPAEPQLPLTHVCDAFSFRKIVDEKKLKAIPCDVFDGECLTYLFYGRPAYRLSETNKATSLPAFLPVCIVLDSRAITNPKRIAPFDTGAFSKQLFAKHMHPKMTINDFLLDTSMDMPPRLVKKFFESNKNYFNTKPITTAVPTEEFEVGSYYSLIRDSSTAPYDDRGSAIEIQTSNSISLTKENVLLVVLPGVFMDSKEIMDTICQRWSANIKTYSIHRCNPQEYMSQIYEMVGQFLEDEEFF